MLTIADKGGRGGKPIQLPRVIEWGVGVNDSREFELLIGCHWHIGGGGMLIG